MLFLEEVNYFSCFKNNSSIEWSLKASLRIFVETAQSYFSVKLALHSKHYTKWVHERFLEAANGKKFPYILKWWNVLSVH